MNKPTLKWRIIKKDEPFAIINQPATSGSIGLDVSIPTLTILPPNSGWIKIPLNVQLWLPVGYYIDVRSRSSTALKLNVDVYTGLIDTDYRNELCLLVRNMNPTNVVLEPQAKIAQLVLCKQNDVIVEMVEEDFPATERIGGFGSTSRAAQSWVPFPPREQTKFGYSTGTKHAMPTMSKITQLKEFCEANRIKSPVYIDKRCGGPDHCPVWVSTVSVDLPWFFANSFNGSRCSTIGEARESAANQAMQFAFVEEIQI